MKKKSWKTTLAAVLAAGGTICTQLSASFDGNPETVASAAVIWGAIVAACGALGIGWFARDDNRSSKDVGAGG